MWVCVCGWMCMCADRLAFLKMLSFAAVLISRAAREGLWAAPQG